MKGSPFTRDNDGKVRDRGGKVIELFPGVREALLEVYREDRFTGTKLPIASRTPEIRWINNTDGRRKERRLFDTTLWSELTAHSNKRGFDGS